MSSDASDAEDRVQHDPLGAGAGVAKQKSLISRMKQGRRAPVDPEIDKKNIKQPVLRKQRAELVSEKPTTESNLSFWDSQTETPPSLVQTTEAPAAANEEAAPELSTSVLNQLRSDVALQEYGHAAQIVKTQNKDEPYLGQP